ncbi:MAG: hypothetical protein HON90_09810 [Halobacteriovoraceae bacterium]|jgi:hypothetical protein|nr:hypothetical protein [Halobacteriovoraceae bacterium]
MSKTKGIRLSDSEERLVNEFLKKNPFFDFSSMARTAISKFIEDPQIKLTPIKRTKRYDRENSNVR